MNDGRKKKPQKHKNTTAFKITFDTQALDHHKKVSLSNLCIRCTDQIQWKLQYNKYKKMSQPARCNICQDKNVFRTYMKACQSCAQSKNICAKCLQADYEPPSQVKVSQKDQKNHEQKQYANQIQFMKTLQQRSRRTVRRHLQKGTISWSNQQQYFVDEEGNKMSGLHFRKGFTVDGNDNEQNSNIQDDDMFGDDLDEDLQDQQEGNKLETQNKNKKKKNQKKSQKSPENQQNAQNDSEPQKQKTDQNKQEKDHNSDIEGDQIDNDEIGLDDQDFEDQDEQSQEEVKQKNKKKSKGNPKSNR